MALLAMVSAMVLGLTTPPDISRAKDLSPTALASDGSLLRVHNVEDGLLRLPVSLDQVAPHFVDMLKSYEDQRFDTHLGVDPLAVLRASYQLVRHGGIVSGASTLTMQLARLLRPQPRSFMAKLDESWRALRLEIHFSKQEILEMYLTLAPYGGRLEGIRSASLSYFGKEPIALTVAEAALLIALPQSPTSRRPDRHPVTARNARNHVLQRLTERGMLSPEAVTIAAAEPVPAETHAMPELAPHLLDHVLAQTPDQPILQTTLDAPLQANLQQTIESRFAHMPDGLTSAVMVVDHRNQHILAHIGSARWGARNKGFIDFSRAIRSPGSTLKPLIYAAGFDAGMIHPQTVVADRLLTDQSYRPTNFDGGYSGDITITDALRHSLNIPVVRVLDRYGARRFHGELQLQGLPLTLPPGAAPTTALGLGGVGTNLWTLMQAYAAVAGNGRVCDLLITNLQQSSCHQGRKLMTAKSQAWVKGILQTVVRPDGRQDGQQHQQMGIAFKTGTSYGHRDAWAIGFSDSHVIGVWVGRADGAPVAAMTGLKMAAPLLMQVFDLLPPDARRLHTDPGKSWAKAPPMALARFDAVATGPSKKSKSNFAFTAPADDQLIQFADYQSRPLQLAITGGKRPYTLLLNGQPLPLNKWAKQRTWQPTAPGFYSLMAIDSHGQIARRYVRIDGQ